MVPRSIPTTWRTLSRLAGVSMVLGMTALTLMLCSRTSAERASVRRSTAALDTA